MTEAFTSALTHIAETGGGRHLTRIIARWQRPVSVAVTGRAGVGRGCVAAALRHGGVAVGTGVGSGSADVTVVVVAEALGEQDADMVRSAAGPVLIVLTKADLSGAGPGGPLAVADRRAMAIRRRTGVPTVAMVGTLAVLGRGLGDDVVHALGRFVAEPPNLTGVDAFLADPHPVDAAVRARLLEGLDRFGIAHAMRALAGGCAPENLGGHLCGLSRLADVLSALDAVAAPVRYRRLHTALRELRCLAVRSADEDLAELLAADATVLAAMTGAVDVVEAEGLTVDRGDSVAAHLDRAVRWRRYGRGPVDAMHRQCSSDIVRGSLRLLAAAQQATS